jgi:hypothetical protein
MLGKRRAANPPHFLLRRPSGVVAQECLAWRNAADYESGIAPGIPRAEPEERFMAAIVRIAAGEGFAA